MATETTVTMELCRSNSIGQHYHEPSVIEYRVVSREEADALLAKTLQNGYFWRVQPADRTGN